MTTDAAARLPPPVRAGARVGVAALSGPVDPRRLEAGLDSLRSCGFEPVAASNLRSRVGCFAGTDGERLAALHELAADASLAAVVFARGGHGLLRILPGLDWRLLGRVPRAWMGYSDVAPFLWEVVRRLRLVAFHGPMVGVDWARGLDGDERDHLLACLAGELPRPLAVTGVAGTAASGKLTGGCLSLLTATLGTPFAADLTDAVLFWEDVGEPFYRIDRMLHHLHLAGGLLRLGGLVVGHTGLTPTDREALLETLLRLRGDAHWPLAVDCPSGHGEPNLVLPLGLRARLDPVAGELVVGEAEGAVADPEPLSP